MQSSKDSFYIALRDRLSALNPDRSVTINGVTRPAIVVVENQHPSSAGPLANVFYITWGEPQAVDSARSSPRPLMSLDCTIYYWTAGTSDNQGIDRGRLLAQLDGELFSICSPPSTPKLDYTGDTPLDLGTTVFWTHPQFTPRAPTSGFTSQTPQLAAAPDDDPDATASSLPRVRLERTAVVNVMFYPENDLP